MSDQIKLFRAVPKGMAEPFVPAAITRRVPRNVPFLVDNIWEWLRPSGMPSRRFAGYAGTSPEHAIACAVNGVTPRSDLIVGLVSFPGKTSVVQITVEDARFHPDIQTLPRLVFEHLGRAWTDLPALGKMPMASLFLPVSDPAEVDQALGSCRDGAKLQQAIRRASRFWDEAQKIDSSTESLNVPAGELFFEAPNGYRFTPI